MKVDKKIVKENEERIFGRLKTFQQTYPDGRPNVSGIRHWNALKPTPIMDYIMQQKVVKNPVLKVIQKIISMTFAYLLVFVAIGLWVLPIATFVKIIYDSF